MTRRNTSILHSINPEIDRAFHRLVRQNRTLDTNFVSVSEHPVTENTASEHSIYVHSEYSDSVHSVAFPNFDHSVHSENMAQPPTPPGPRERTLRELAGLDFTYDSFCIQYEDVPYVLKTGLIHLLPKFNGLAGQDPHKHLKEFHIVCSTMKPLDVMEDHICLKAFPHSLEVPTKDWLYYLAPASITSWGYLKRSLGKFFPASRTTTIRKDISGIRRQHAESLYEYWERSIIDVASGGALGDMTPFESRSLIEKMASNSHQFNARSGDAIVIRGVHDVRTNAARQDKLETKIDSLTTLIT
ncbi:hypothetical protein Lal_00038420 [Lupinus albus]|nr:hypothetical protein Lal_00038420 [Lupinus albus]